MSAFFGGTWIAAESQMSTNGKWCPSGPHAAPAVLLSPFRSMFWITAAQRMAPITQFLCWQSPAELHICIRGKATCQQATAAPPLQWLRAASVGYQCARHHQPPACRPQVRELWALAFPWGCRPTGENTGTAVALYVWHSLLPATPLRTSWAHKMQHLSGPRQAIWPTRPTKPLYHQGQNTGAEPMEQERRLGWPTASRGHTTAVACLGERTSSAPLHPTPKVLCSARNRYVSVHSGHTCLRRRLTDSLRGSGLSQNSGSVWQYPVSLPRSKISSCSSLAAVNPQTGTLSCWHRSPAGSCAEERAHAYNHQYHILDRFHNCLKLAPVSVLPLQGVCWHQGGWHPGDDRRKPLATREFSRQPCWWHHQRPSSVTAPWRTPLESWSIFPAAGGIILARLSGHLIRGGHRAKKIIFLWTSLCGRPTTAWCWRLQQLPGATGGRCQSLSRGGRTHKPYRWGLQAEIALLRKVQRECFPEDLSLLSEGKPVTQSSRLLTFAPEYERESQLIHVRGWLRRCEDLEEDTLHPVVLDPRHPITRLIIQDFDTRLAHPGPERVYAELRRQFWILRGRAAVKKHQFNCPECQRWRASPVVPRMADLPSSSLRLHRPAFYSTGMDCFGPYTIKIGRRNEKRWGIVFKCLTTHAVHLDLLASMDTDVFLMALRRFITCRGKPHGLLSDQGTNFRGSSSELQEAFKALAPDLQNQLASQQIQFQFNPPNAPHFGGSLEREICSIKSALHATLGAQTVTEDVLMTVLIEVEGIIRSPTQTPSLQTCYWWGGETHPCLRSDGGNARPSLISSGLSSSGTTCPHCRPVPSGNARRTTSQWAA